MRRNIGFTLIELLIVVAIIAILAAIAVPNFLEAQVRSKVARCQADMRTLSVAIEAYAIDWNTYGLRATGANSARALKGWVAITTPIAYVNNFLFDPFTWRGRKRILSGNAAYQFTTGSFNSGSNGEDDWPRTAFLALSFGPDADDDTDIGSFPRAGKAMPYDSTNGTNSDGDIYRLQSPSADPSFKMERFVVGN